MSRRCVKCGAIFPDEVTSEWGRELPEVISTRIAARAKGEFGPSPSARVGDGYGPTPRCTALVKNGQWAQDPTDPNNYQPALQWCGGDLQYTTAAVTFNAYAREL